MTEFTIGRKIIAIIGLLVVALAGGSITISVVDPQYALLWTAILSLAWIAVLPFAYEYARGNRLDPFAPIFWVAPLFFFTYGAQAGLRLLNDNFSFSGQYTASVHPSVIMLDVLVLASVGLIAIYAGYYWKRSQSFASVLPTFGSEWSSRRAWIAISGLMISGLVGYYLLQPDLGSGPRTGLAKGASKYAFIAVNLLNTASILVIADTFIDLDSGDGRMGFSYRSLLKAVVAFGIVVFNMLILWTLGGRGRAFGILIVSLFLIHYLFRRFSMVTGMSLYTVIKVVPAWAIGLFTALIALDFNGFVAELRDPYLFLASPNTPFNNIVILFAGVPEVVPFQYGKTFLSAFFALVPYQPVPQTQVVYNRAFLPAWGTEAGVPITMLGELYLNFWIPGIVIGLLVIGIVMRIVYDWLVVSGSNPASLVLFATISNNFLLMGNFSNSAPKLGLAVLPMIVVLYYISDGFGTLPSVLANRRVK